MNAARVMAIFEKDLKEFTKNTTILFTPFITIILAIIYSRMETGDGLPLIVVYAIVGITYASVTSGVMMILMAEENEKKTLRGLIMSPASYVEILLGKSLVTALMTFITLIISFIIMESTNMIDIQQIIGLLVLFFFFLFLGIAVGLFVKSVGMTTVYLMPIMFIFGFTSMIEFLGFSPDSIVIKITDYMPIPQLVAMGETESWSAIGIVLIWTIVAGILAFVCFQKVKKDRA